MKIFDVVSMIRSHQWYKNLVIFFALIFSGNLLNLNFVGIIFMGFLIMILISSSNYILNDLIDINKDKLNPEKSKRPIASGKIKKSVAIFFFSVLLILSLLFSYLLNKYFFFVVAGIFVVSTLYTLFLKEILFADIIAISSGFVLRAVAGAILINVYISSWLVIGVFFFAMFLVTGKRYGEFNFLKKNAGRHRKVLQSYSKDIFHSLFNIFMAILIITFALYCISSPYTLLIWTIPLFVYIVLRYYYLIISNSEIVRNPEKAIRDLPLLIASVLFVIIGIILILV